MSPRDLHVDEVRRREQWCCASARQPPAKIDGHKSTINCYPSPTTAITTTTTAIADIMSLVLPVTR